MINIYEYIAWIPMILFCGAPLAQVYLNWVNQSTKRLSQWSVFLGISGLLGSLLYDYFMWLPFAYRFMHPLILLAWTGLALQEFWYSKRENVRYGLLYGYGALLLVVCFALFWGTYYPLQVGFVAGWAFTCLYAVFQLPQIIKNQQERSVEGLSFSYISMMGFASMIDLSIAYFRLLPLPSVLNALRGVLVYVVFLYQFNEFGCKKKKGKRAL